MSAQPVNHHADHPGFSGVVGATIGLELLLTGRPVARLAADLADVAPGDHVVDIGCGPGNAVRKAAHRGARATGVDPAPVMLRLARLVTRVGGIDWREGTAESVPLADGAATVWWSLATVHHWKDVAGGLREAHRVLALGGRLLALERQVRPGAKGFASHGWTREQADAFAEHCREAGFTEARVTGHRAGLRNFWAVRALRA